MRYTEQCNIYKAVDDIHQCCHRYLEQYFTHTAEQFIMTAPTHGKKKMPNHHVNY